VFLIDGVDDSLEPARIGDRDLCEHLAIERDVRTLETRDELAVVQPIAAGCGVDAGDPKATVLTLLGATVPVGILSGVVDLFDRNVKGLAARAVVALGVVEQAIAATAGFEPSFDSGHGRSP